jgi:arylsulfatase A
MKISNRAGKVLTLCAALILLQTFVAAATIPAGRPNVIIILADDLGCGDMSLYDGWVKTPRIDQMAAEGVRFTDFHSNGSVCSPTRAAFMTGRYQQRAGILSVIVGRRDKIGLEPSEVTISGLLKNAGYNTAIFGKWHCGTDIRHNPTNHGFDEFIGFLPGGCDYLAHGDWMDGTEVKNQDGYSTDIITDRSIDFIKLNKDKPFFLYVSHQAVHNYYQIPSDPPGTRGRDIPLEGKEAQARYEIMLKGLDDSVGEILHALKELDLDENTFVFFFSDNGDVRMSPNERPYRGGKWSNYEGGHRVPAVARWPGRIKAGWTSDELTVGMDLLPTVMDIVGVDIPKQRKFDGISIKGHLLDQVDLPDRQIFFGCEPEPGTALGTAMRDGNWKMQTKGDVVELYDLSKDIKETTNIADKYPERTGEMKAAIENWKVEVEANAEK